MSFRRVDSEVDSLVDKEEHENSIDAEKMTALVKEALGKDDTKVEVKPLANADVPVMLIEDEQMRRFSDMSRLYGERQFDMPSSYNVILNSRNETIAHLSEREKDERSVLLMKQLYDLAALSNKPLNAEQMTAFIRRSMEIVDMASKG